MLKEGDKAPDIQLETDTGERARDKLEEALCRSWVDRPAIEIQHELALQQPTLRRQARGLSL